MSIRARIVGRNGLSAFPLQVKILEGARVSERIHIAREKISADKFGPFGIEQVILIDFDGDQPKVVGVEQPEPGPTP